MTAVLARLIARYIAGALVAYGLIDSGTGQTIALDPDLALAIGAGITAITEGGYAMAKKYGWAT